MELKTHPPVTVLFSSHRVNLHQLAALAGTVVKELYSEALQNDVLVSGPVYWIYHGMDGKPDTIFTLEIAIPIQGYFKSNKFSIKSLPAFRAIAHTHRGAWDELAGVYGQLLQHIDSERIPINEECRELYINVDLQQPANNITEVQMGVA